MSNVNQQEKQVLDSTSDLNVKIETYPKGPVPATGIYTIRVNVTSDNNSKEISNQRIKLSVTDPQGNPVLGEDGNPQVYTNADGRGDTLTDSHGVIFFTPYLRLNKHQTQTGIYTIKASVEGSGIEPAQLPVEFQ
ncbi:hypothetical protein [Xenorhabdus eapokensis]|uniref:Invasin n=1 Tax=Xenorhabdus eapokensis TaxID=1873482 RepID=A0A1Q5TTR5_9GAMM|nr:hypothetical protein [Xenorhabdus eapokensis]OKP03621.1 hypothetical protein Xedl_01592 [Xenorhabdus eapokensis]